MTITYSNPLEDPIPQSFWHFQNEMARTMHWRFFLGKMTSPIHAILNESRFLFLSHPNIISIIKTQDHEQIIFKREELNVSAIVMELALYGDFSKIVMQPFFTQDEKLVRTYFRQFIEGLGYLHKNSVAHLDIKLENLLLTEQFTFKNFRFWPCFYWRWPQDQN